MTGREHEQDPYLWVRGDRVTNGRDLCGTLGSDVNEYGNVLVLWDDHQRSWSQARLLIPERLEVPGG